MTKLITSTLAALLLIIAITIAIGGQAHASILHRHNWYNCGHSLRRDNPCWDTYKVRTVYTDSFHHVIHVTPWRLYAE